MVLSDMYLFCALREELDLAGAAREELAPTWLLQPHALELRDLVCPGLQATSCQASWVTRRGHVQCLWLPGWMWSKQGNAPQGFPLLLSDPTPIMDLCSLPSSAVPWGGAGEAVADSQGWRKMCYISLKKRRLACHVNRN